MAEEEHFTELEVNETDTIEDSELPIDSENVNNTSEDDEMTNNGVILETESSELMETEGLSLSNDKKLKNTGNKTEVVKTTKLPIARIKSIMKQDPDVHLINSDALFLVTKATELFLETLVKETYTFTAAKKKKTITKKDLDSVINVVDCLCFLDGALEY